MKKLNNSKHIKKSLPKDKKKREQLRVKKAKKRLIAAMIESLGIVTTACKEVGISRKTYYEYYNTDKDFAKAINDIENIVLDFSESKLHGLIKADNTAAIIFHLKCRGKGRGYFEKQEFKMDKPADQVMIIGGQEIVFH